MAGSIGEGARPQLPLIDLPDLSAQSRIDAAFWSELCDRKLDTYQLSEDAVPLTGESKELRCCMHPYYLLTSP